MADDTIYRQAAIDAIAEMGFKKTSTVKAILQRLETLPSAQPEYRLDEWCTECKEYDHERHCCPRFNHVIRTTLQEAQERKKGKWIYLNGLDAFECSVCGRQMVRNIFDYCPWCGAEMTKGEEDE